MIASDKRAGPASVRVADNADNEDDTADNKDDGMGDAAPNGVDNLNEDNAHDGEDNTMESAIESTIRETNLAEPVVFGSDLAIHTSGPSSSSGTTVAEPNLAGDRDLQINEIAETLTDFGSDTISDMVT